MSHKRLLLVHAHPDDESSQSAATIARYADEGAQVTLVTCTLGERGEILVPEWNHYSEKELGEHRIAELQQAMDHMGLTDHMFLGGVGHYHDTGMDRAEYGTVIVPPDMPDNAFWNADLLEAANFLVEIIRSRRPQVVSTYNPFGGYGHPDHVQAHRVTMYAVILAGARSHAPELGEAWSVDRVLWGTHNTGMWKQALSIAKERGLKLWDGEERDEDTLGPKEEYIEAVVPIGEYYDVCRAALGSHPSQVNIEDPFWEFHGIIQQLPGAGEAYVFGSGVPFPASDEPHEDLFIGLNLD
ncbi:MAG: N-acetyl-1-D-myo-inositol-2-amino-2-deoxy-alpha-D-glucopyranoside deacetylase [Propionibacterium sp.]|nr:N-acetyl-1-D-myo-inositol-2-amino-2-deoxy-alpha-D-glucopyranoside deacetylase [Propionibacterium sp.]